MACISSSEGLFGAALSSNPLKTDINSGCKSRAADTVSSPKKSIKLPTPARHSTPHMKQASVQIAVSWCSYSVVMGIMLSYTRGDQSRDGFHFSTYVVKQHGELPLLITNRPVTPVCNPELCSFATNNINNTTQRREKKERKNQGRIG